MIKWLKREEPEWRAQMKCAIEEIQENHNLRIEITKLHMYHKGLLDIVHHCLPHKKEALQEYLYKCSRCGMPDEEAEKLYKMYWSEL